MMDSRRSNSTSKIPNKERSKTQKWKKGQKRNGYLAVTPASAPVHQPVPVPSSTLVPTQTPNATSLSKILDEPPIRSHEEAVQDLLFPNPLACETFGYWQRLFSELKEIPYILTHHKIKFLMRKNDRCTKEKRFKCLPCSAYFSTLEEVNCHMREPIHLSQLRKMRLSTTCILAPELPFGIKTVLNSHLENIIEVHGLSVDDIDHRESIAEDINKILMNELPGCSVKIFGSTYHQMGLKSSDLNLALIINSPMESASAALVQLSELMSHNSRVHNLEVNFHEGEPHLAFNFDSTDSILCKITLHNECAIALSRLMLQFSVYDCRLKYLCVLMRLWGKICKLDNEDEGLLPGFTFYLLVVCYLHRCRKVLPFIPDILLKDFKSPDFRVNLAPWHSEDCASLCELWKGMFSYYSSESNDHKIVYITQTKPHFRKMFLSKSRMLIFDPITSKTVKGFYNCESQHYITYCFKSTHYYYSIPHTNEGPIFGAVRVNMYPDDSSIPRLKDFYSTQNALNGCLVKLIPFYDNNYHKMGIEKKGNILDKIKNLSTEQLLVNSSQVNDDVFRFDTSMPRSKPFHNKYREVIVSPDDAEYLIEQLDYSKISYNFSWESFTCKKSAPKCCSLCFEDNHVKAECPEDILPPLEVLAEINTSLVNIINQLCEDVYVTHLPSKKDYEVRNEIVTEIQNCLRQAYPDARLSLFGSSRNGFGLKESDLDICLYFEGFEVLEKKSWTENVQELLKRCQYLKNIICIPTAKVPIVKFVHGPSCLAGDISLYSSLAQENTALFKTYSQVDLRVKKLGTMLKRFAKVCNIGDASRGTLSSYSYTIMLIYFLQQVYPPVLPVLHEIRSDNPDDLKSVKEFDCEYFTAINKLPDFWPYYRKNDMTVGELWIKLLRFYTEVFDFEKMVISICTIEKLNKFNKLWLTKKIAIEDPFNKRNVAVALTRKMNIFILKAFRKGRLHFSTLPPPSSTKSLEEYYFDSNILGEIDPPNDHGCYLCKSFGHKSKDCHLKLDQKVLNKEDKRDSNNLGGKTPSDQEDNSSLNDNSKKMSGLYLKPPSAQIYKLPHEKKIITAEIFKNIDSDLFYNAEQSIVGRTIRNISNSAIVMQMICPKNSLPYFNSNTFRDVKGSKKEENKPPAYVNMFKRPLGGVVKSKSSILHKTKSSDDQKDTDLPRIKDTYLEMMNLLKLTNSS